jgi:hypothetical protein
VHSRGHAALSITVILDDGCTYLSVGVPPHGFVDHLAGARCAGHASSITTSDDQGNLGAPEAPPS